MKLVLIIKALLISIITVHITAVIPQDRTELFNKDQKMDRLVLSNQIGYHFKRVVREVSQELFVSRRIDVSSLFLGIQVLKQTQEGLSKYCRGLSYSTMDHRINGKEGSQFIHISEPKLACFAEAKARCAARSLQLPEIYTNVQRDALSTYLRSNDLRTVFAGVEPDLIDSVPRFISTGFPIWKMPHESLVSWDGKQVDQKAVLGVASIKFAYSSEGRMIASWDIPNVVDISHIGDPGYRNKNAQLSQLLLPIVCEPKWDGTSYTHFRSDYTALTNFVIKNRYLREVSPPSRNESQDNMDEFVGIKSLREYCYSIVAQASEIHQDMSNKLEELLSLVDISIQIENNSGIQTRDKRSIFLARFIFSTGVRLIWNLFGFVQTMRLNKKVAGFEADLAKTNSRLDINSQAIQNMSLLIYDQSIAIKQLKITTAELDSRIVHLEMRVTRIEKTLDDIINKLESTLSLSLIENLIQRIQQSLSSGYDTLKDIIHCSLLGQTSPLLLPVDQIQLVQNEVRKSSNAIFDTDFAKMKSVVVSDPRDPHLLLVVINVAALSRKNVELIKLIPVPYFKGSLTYSVALDYDTIILDQLARTYSVLNEQEEYDCLFNRCYISDVERSVNDKTCGIPQLFGQHLDVCVSEEILSTGVFIKPMLPDGIIFAFREEVSTQLFCKDNNNIGPLRQLNGTGIMQLPNGCTLSVSDLQGRSTKVKGQPLYKMIDAEDLVLSINGPLSALQSAMRSNFTQRTTLFSASLSNHLSSMVRQVETVDSKINNQKTSIWILVGALMITITLVLTIVILGYRYSGKIYQKIRDLRTRFTDIVQTVQDARKRITGGIPPPVAPKPNFGDTLSKALMKDRKDENIPDSPSGKSTPTYMSLSEVSPPSRIEPRYAARVFKPVEPSSSSPGSYTRQYPRMTPFLRELAESDIAHESAEVEKLCAMKLAKL